jgi:hypothetical protein
MSFSSFSRIKDQYVEPASQKRSRPVEDEALDILLRMDEENTRHPGTGSAGRPNIGMENASSQLDPGKKQNGLKSVPKKEPTTRPSEVARRLLKKAVLLKRQS